VPVQTAELSDIPIRTTARSTFSIHADRDRSLAICEAMIDIAAALFNVSSKELRRTGRTAQEVARVRQIAMYVAHVTLGIPQGEVGRGFGRDRTTVLHACHLIEDLRDDAEFDRIVAVAERIALAAFGART
jgi:chromosomal replication initiation ATPase DnaA